MMSWFHLGPGSKSTADPTAELDESAQRRPPETTREIISTLPTHFVGASTTRGSSPPGSFVHSSSRSIRSDARRDIRCEMVANWLHVQSAARLWISDQPGEGVFVKRSKGRYAHSPADLSTDGTGICAAITALNVPFAMTVSTRMIKLIISRTELSYVQIQHGQRLQVVPDFAALPYCQKNQSAAFVASQQILVVWEDDPKMLLDRAQTIQDLLIWGDELFRASDKAAAQSIDIDVADLDEILDDIETTQSQPRKTKLWQAVYTSMAICLLTITIGSAWRHVAIEQIHAPNWLRLLFILPLPAQAWLSLFFFQALVGNAAQIFGSLQPLKTNSRYYSAKISRRLHRDVHGQLPHVTIQMPVYKEGLEGVIKPTVQSIKKAISTYELQGGTANIFVNDDGMQLISQEDALERQEFYEENCIGWVARPKHNPVPEPGERRFTRRGKFKKASNMNYALRLSLQVEEKLATVERDDKWSQLQENQVYEAALEGVLADRAGEAWADGSIRVGDYILLIDSDTRVPQDCLLDAVSEMEQCPEVAIMQYVSGVMNVSNSFFENGITFFTNMIYTMIRFSVANGDVAPFVGHNAILRWNAIQDIAYDCDMDKWEKFWSESTVSEDFDMALRLQCEGYTVRLAGYTGDGFKEGVSLTVYDELNRWEKYAYGCNELIFHPLKDWIFKGPFTNLFLVFVFSNMPLPSKITIMSYIGTYYAMGSAWVFTILNYFLVGFFNGDLDHYYLDSFRVYVSLVFVFTFMGNVSLAWLRYRTEDRNLLWAFWENVKWIPMVTIFLGGLSLHVSQALLCHFFSIDMEWGSTSKEVEDVSFIEAMRHVGKKFKWTFLFCGAMIAAMVCCAYVINEEWRIKVFIAVWPMGLVIVNHVLLPIVLNPQLMTFTW
ncbi:glycosyl transferase family group 2-domain-containing protein [Phaeosphaeria sp. MPI-PUGE-AT-0046c]|nr:glycosyl transferase family group 2-domain-containing protein [Phaeosphaeria sp. MPI-PUGE-AT-0046c]